MSPALSLVTFLGHFCQVRLSEDFGHPEDHQRIFGIHQIGPDRSVQKHLEELRVHEQVLMNKGLPAGEKVIIRTSSVSLNPKTATIPRLSPL